MLKSHVKFHSIAGKRLVLIVDDEIVPLIGDLLLLGDQWIDAPLHLLDGAHVVVVVIDQLHRGPGLLPDGALQIGPHRGEVVVKLLLGQHQRDLPVSPQLFAHGDLFRVLVVAMVLFGSFADLGLVWDSADLFMGFLCLTNLYAIARLGKYAFLVLDDYVSQKARGIDEPVFDKNIMPNKDGVKSW